MRHKGHFDHNRCVTSRRSFSGSIAAFLLDYRLYSDAHSFHVERLTAEQPSKKSHFSMELVDSSENEGLPPEAAIGVISVNRSACDPKRNFGRDQPAKQEVSCLSTLIAYENTFLQHRVDGVL